MIKLILLLILQSLSYGKDFFYEELGRTAAEFMLYGISIGIVLMAAIYSLVLYRHNKTIMLIYYFLLQLSVAAFLMNTSGIFLLSTYDFGTSSTYYDSIIIISSIMSFVFARAFLETKKYSPILHMLLNGLLILLIFEFIITLLSQRFITTFLPFSLFLVFILIVAWIRYRQKYVPALYFFYGWSCLIVSVAFSEIYRDSLTFSPIFIGSPLEAIFVAFALTYSIRQLKEEQKIQQAIMIHQSKLASMGELLGNIAHQWRQPLTNLSYIFMNIKSTASIDEYINDKSDEGMKQLQFMSDTIDNFRNFYHPDTHKEFFSLYEQTLYALGMVEGEFQRHNIATTIDLIEDSSLYNYKNQYVQVLLNILVNAKDAFISSNATHPALSIQINKNTITIQDNAGGIASESIEKIFEPYFTTKSQHSGVGLYMCKTIVEKNMSGKMSVSNSDRGARFELIF
ncbi:sensor histidine kinase [Sulfuricurvum sp.]|uniref:sensor histidine kinase n=1 Tax=Sulfuricurvum sp. TaxID=2025608 RepID=UPI002601F8C8|nr:sensor histidine kinase [Sulfuricurvum sp.]MDD4884415.1 sensor histidine kinase [Sulfuricurvum sp.]